MPNWCSNNVTFTHNDPAMIQRLVDAYNADRLLSEFLPCPIDPEKDPHLDWHSWRVNNWGTKWDVSSVDEVTADGNSVTVYFDSAWSPPIEFYRWMEEEMDFEVRAYYWEPGMGFCGIYERGDDDSYEVAHRDSAWVMENIPKSLDDMFSISASMEVWEEDNGNAA